MEKDCVKHNFDEGQPGFDFYCEDEDHSTATHDENFQTESKSGQLLEMSEECPPTPTNDTQRTSKPAVSVAVCNKAKLTRRKMSQPHKVSGEEAQVEGDLKISRRPMVTRLKLPSSPHRTVPCRKIKRPRSSAVCHRRIPSKVARGETFGCLKKKVAPFDRTSQKHATPVLAQPESSTLYAKTLERRKWESVSPLKDDKAIKITPALPESAHVPTVPQTTPGTSSAGGQEPVTTEEPLLIHGLSVEEYLRLYHSVVDPMLLTASSNPRRYSLKLGRAIKQRLWERLFCPQLREEVQADGRVKITETFCHPALFQHAPLMEVDVSDEPAPEHVERKRPMTGTHKMENNSS